MSGLFFTYFNDQSFVDSYHIIGFESSFSLHMIRSNGIKIFVLPDTPNNNDSSLARVADPIDARHQAARKIGWSADLFDEKHVKRFFSYHCMPRVIEKLPIAVIVATHLRQRISGNESDGNVRTGEQMAGHSH